VDLNCGIVVEIMEMKCETSLENREGAGIAGGNPMNVS
jgi:hypothetical protein